MRQAGVGDFGTTEIKRFKAGQPPETGQAGGRHRGPGEYQPLQPAEPPYFDQERVGPALINLDLDDRAEVVDPDAIHQPRGPGRLDVPEGDEPSPTLKPTRLP